MTSNLRNEIREFIRKHPLISPSLARFPVPDTFWKAGIPKNIFRLTNYYFTYSQMLSGKDKVRGGPSHLTVDVTNICNLRCPLCPTGVNAPGREKGMMPLATFKKIIDQTRKYLISIDLFNWGEPLLNKDVYSMIAYAHAYDIVTSVSTNFQYFSEASAEKLLSSGLDILILSIDGASQESYGKYRVGGDFRKVTENISILARKKKERGVNHPYVCWQFLVMKHNEHEIEMARAMATELGADNITFDHAYLPVATRQEAIMWLPENPKYHRYNLADLEKMWAAEETREETSSDEPTAQRDLRRANCSWLWTQTTINWDGSVSPCCAIFEPTHDFGNISDSAFKEVWNNEKYMASRCFSSKGQHGVIETICMRCPLAIHG